MINTLFSALAHLFGTLGSALASASDALSSSDVVSAVDAVSSATAVAPAESSGISARLLLGIVLAGILTGNYVLSRFLGCCPFLGVSKKLDTAVGMSAAVIFVMLLATAVTYPIYSLLSSFGLEYLQTIVFILVIAALVQLVEIVLKKYMPTLYESLGVYLPLITTNCAVLGVAINVCTDYFGTEGGYLSAMCAALGAGLGFLVAMVLFAGVRGRLESSDIPEALQGLPITLIAAAIVALSFMGFSGLIAGLGLE